MKGSKYFLIKVFSLKHVSINYRFAKIYDLKIVIVLKIEIGCVLTGILNSITVKNVACDLNWNPG